MSKGAPTATRQVVWFQICLDDDLNYVCFREAPTGLRQVGDAHETIAGAKAEARLWAYWQLAPEPILKFRAF